MFTETNNYEKRIYTCVILMAFLALSESVYAAIPVLTVASDTIRRVVIYFDKEETDIDFSYKTNNHEINVLDSLLEEKNKFKIYHCAQCGHFCIA